MKTMFYPYDIVFTSSDSLLAKAIRWATREEGEGPTKVNHVGVISNIKGDSPTIIEALRKVRMHSMERYVKNGHKVAVFRPRNLSPLQRLLIRKSLARQVGKGYGYGKLVAHGIARLTRWEWVRRLGRIDQEDVCSSLVARAFARAGLSFGVEGREATPDDIWDFCLQHPEHYKAIIYPARRITLEDFR